MNTKTMLLLGVGLVAAYLLFLRPKKATTQSTINNPPGNNYVAAGIAGGTKILSQILTMAGSGSGASTTPTNSGIVTSYE